MQLEVSLQYYFRVCAFVGQFPFIVTPLGLVPSPILRLYNVVLGLGHVGLMVFVMSHEMEDSVDGVVVHFAPVLATVLIITTIAVPTVNSEGIITVFRRFNVNDQLFRRLGLSLHEKKSQIIPLLIIFAYLLYTLIYTVFDYLFPVWVTAFPVYAHYLHLVNFVMAFVVANTNTISYLLKLRFRQINVRIKQMKIQISGSRYQRKIQDQNPMKEAWQCYKSELYSPFANKPDFLKARRSPERDRKIKQEIKILQRCSYQLCQICSSVGSMFTLPVVLTVLYTCIELLITSYTALTMLLYEDDLDAVKLATCIKWALIDVLRILCILLAFAKIEKEGNETPTLVHGLLLETENVEIQNELMKFSQQLTHHKLNFSTCGLFNLDMSLLVSIAGATTTYLVILLQFAKPEERSRTTTTTML